MKTVFALSRFCRAGAVTPPDSAIMDRGCSFSAQKNKRRGVLEKFVVLAITLLSLTLPARAGMFEQDAEYRSQEMLKSQQRQRADYAERQKAHHRLAVKEEARLQQEMEKPPWRRGSSASAADKSSGRVSHPASSKKGKRGSWVFGVFGLLAVGGITWWIKHLTREADTDTF